MAFPKSPFAASSSSPGLGQVELSLLPPGTQVLTSFAYQYPLKLIAPDSHTCPSGHVVTLIFLLTYGGGLVGGDKINLTVKIARNTRLALTTQGSTKIFKSPERAVASGQALTLTIGDGASLCYLPDPTQPFAESIYEQRQTFLVNPNGGSSLCVLDWVSEGRRSRGESWHFWSWNGRNEVRELAGDSSNTGRLLLRDAVMLSDSHLDGSNLAEKTNDMGVFGTLIIYGPIFKSLGDFFIQEFKDQPRIGAKNWSGENRKTEDQQISDKLQQQHKEDGLLWTAADVRGFVLVKFGSREVDGARRWLSHMIKHEGSVEKEFGHQALISLR